jgi:membrane protease YdiL (CAAX protease family)
MTLLNRFFAQLSTPQIAPPWSLIDALITLVALALTMLLLGPTLALLLTGGDGMAVSPMTLLLGWGIGLGAAAAFTVFSRRRTREQWSALKLGAATQTRLPLPYLLLFAIGMMLLFDLIAAIGSGFRPVAVLTGIGAGGVNEWLLAGLFLVVIQPFAESLIFAGVVLPRLRASLGPLVGMVATCVLFGIFHAAVYGAALSGTALLWFGAVLPLLQGIFLCSVRVTTDSTRATIVAYMGMGLVALLAALALVR